MVLVMEKKEKFSSLFDVASSTQKKKAKETEKPAERPRGEPLPLENLETAFARYKEMHDEIKAKIEDAFEQAKISPNKVREYFSTPTNFPSAVWREVVETKQELKEKLDSLLPKRSEEEEKEPEVQLKKKTKTGFTSKKRWMQM